MAVESKQAAVGPSSVRIVKRRALPDITAAFAELVAAIPAAGTDTGAMAIVSRMLDAEAPGDLNTVGELPGGEDVAGRVIVVTGLTRHQSDYEGALGVYLVVDAVDATTGEVLRFGTGSTGIIAALAVAHSRGWLPPKCEVVKASKPTKSGYYPHNLRVYGSPTAF